MAEIRDILVIDSSKAEAAIDRVVASAQSMRKTGAGAVKDFEKGLGSAGEAATSLAKEIEALNKKAMFDRLKASSDEYRDALKRCADASKALSAANDDVESSTRRLGESMFTTANQALSLGQKSIQAARGLVDFARGGVEASRATALFRGNLDGLRAASGGAIDDTTLQNLDTMARRTGLASSEIESLTRLSMKFREPGQQMTDVFRQMMDASPEQLEKWGILTSEMVESLKDLDTVQQKQALRQALVAEGMAVTNEEIAAQTGNVEQLNTQWENAVSSVQSWTASVLNSDGAKAATDRFTDSLAGLGDMLGIIGGAWSDLGDELGTDGLLGVIVESSTGLLTLGRLWGDMTDASEVALGAVKAFQDEQAAGWAQLRTEMQQTIDAMHAAEATKVANGDHLSTEDLMLSDWSDDGTENLGRSDPRDRLKRGRIKDPSSPRGSRSRRQQALPDYGGALAGAIAPGFGYGNSDGAGAFGALGRAFDLAEDPEGPIGSGLLGLAKTNLADVEEMFASTADTVVENWNDRLDKLEMASLRNLALDTSEALSNAFLGSFENIIAGGDSFRANMMGVMGELWGQLSAGFLAWATAEGNLLAGNPFGAVAAAAALGAVGAAISGLARRGSGGGSSSGTSAQRFNEQERQRQEQKPETKMTIEMVGIPVPDEVSRQLAGAVARNMQLRGTA